MKKNCDILEFYDLGDRVISGTSYRINGSSEIPFKSLNLGFNSGDKLSNILDNYNILIKKLNLTNKFLFLTKQVHGNEIKVITEDDLKKVALNNESDIKSNRSINNYDVSKMITFIDGYDGMVTNLKEVALMTFYADCVPLMFYDPIKNVIGNCHAGWRGTVKKIPSVLISRMISEFGSKPSDILVAIGPCASACCYEVDKKVIDEFDDSFSNSNGLYREIENSKYMLDLKYANKLTLLESGIKEKNISLSKSCTICNNDLFFSYRAENSITGRHSAIITIK